jgi:hypothetical protein
MWKLTACGVGLALLSGCAGGGPGKETRVILEQTQTTTYTLEYLDKVAEIKKAMNGQSIGLPSVNQSVTLSGFDLDTKTDQNKADNVAPDFTIPIAQQGGQANVGSTTETAKAVQDNSLKDSANDNSTPVFKADKVKVPVESGTTASDNDDVSVGTGDVANADVLITQYPFHHTQLNGATDGGVSLVLCPGDDNRGFKCSQGDINVPYHGTDKVRVAYWNMRESGTGAIVCIDGDKTYSFKTVNTEVHKGKCE